MDDRVFSGRLFPSGRITIGYVPRKKIAVDDTRYESDRGHYAFCKRSHWDYQEGIVNETVIREEKPPSLGLSSIPIHHKPERKRHGLNGISRRGRHKVLEGGTVMQERFGRKVGFYTLTCPYTEQELIYEYNKCFPEIQRRFFQEMKREYERKECKFYYVSVTEIQPERYQDSGVVALHLHYCAPCYIPGTYEFVVSSDRIRSIYARVLSAVVFPPESVAASLDSQVVRSSVSGYLAKYLSKGSDEIRVIADSAPGQIPSRWWSMAKPILKSIQSLTISLPQDVCASLIYTPVSTQELSAFLYYSKHIYIPSPTGERCVGLAAAAREPFASCLRPLTYQCMIDEIL